jgi:hypothetical protein
LNLLDSLDAIGALFSDLLGRQGRPGLIAWYDRNRDCSRASNDDSFSRKIQIRSVLEILVFANGQTPSQAETLRRDFNRHNGGRDLT